MVLCAAQVADRAYATVVIPEKKNQVAVRARRGSQGGLPSDFDAQQFCPESNIVERYFVRPSNGADWPPAMSTSPLSTALPSPSPGSARMRATPKLARSRGPRLIQDVRRLTAHRSSSWSGATVVTGWRPAPPVHMCTARDSSSGLAPHTGGQRDPRGDRLSTPASSPWPGTLTRDVRPAWTAWTDTGLRHRRLRWWSRKF